jgi:hypothetical protein
MRCLHQRFYWPRRPVPGVRVLYSPCCPLNVTRFSRGGSPSHHPPSAASTGCTAALFRRRHGAFCGKYAGFNQDLRQFAPHIQVVLIQPGFVPNASRQARRLDNENRIRVVDSNVTGVNVVACIRGDHIWPLWLVSNDDSSADHFSAPNCDASTARYREGGIPTTCRRRHALGDRLDAATDSIVIDDGAGADFPPSTGNCENHDQRKRDET